MFSLSLSPYMNIPIYIHVIYIYVYIDRTGCLNFLPATSTCSFVHRLRKEILLCSSFRTGYWAVNHKKLRATLSSYLSSQWKVPWLVDWCSGHHPIVWGDFQLTSLQFTPFFSAFPNLSWCTMYTSYVVDTWPLTTGSLSQLPKTGPWGSTSSEALLPSSWAEIGKCSWFGIPVLLRAQQDCLQFGGGEIWGLQLMGCGMRGPFWDGIH